MNYFVFCNGVVYLLAAGYSGWHGHYAWVVVWASYGISAMALAFLEA